MPQSFKHLRRTDIQTLHRIVLRWYALHRRPFPWRNTRDPYKILLSEIMLQQTQTSRVAEYFPRWLRRFPTILSLARASAGDVLRTWSGLGYNNRALRFHKAAQSVAQRRPARIPPSPEELQKLPGIGRYTAHAVACFAYGQNVPVVDVNIKRIVTRLSTTIRSPFDTVGDDVAWEIARSLLPKRKAYDWNQALMDLGATVCTLRTPLCASCPAATVCMSASSSVFISGIRKKKKREPSRKGIPRRLYRGKILKLVHHRPLTVLQASSLVWNIFSEADTAWLETVMEKMCSEGLMKKHRSFYTLA